MTKKILNELFFGKDKDLLEIESLFRQMKDLEKLEKNILQKNAIYFGSEVARLLDRMETIIEEKFNVKSVVLVINRNLTAFTIPTMTMIGDPINYFTGKSYDLEKDNHGYKFKHTHPLMSITLGVPLIQTLEPDELTAVLLHEIGHNFYNITIVQKILYAFLLLPLLLINIIVTLLFFIDANKAIAENKNKETINKIVGLLINPLIELILNPSMFAVMLVKNNSNRFKGNIIGRYFFLFLNNLLNALLAVSSIPGMILNAIQLAIGFLVGDGMDNEKFADNFASMYGYGGALSTGLDKLTNILRGNIFENKEETNTLVKICNEFSEIMMVMLHALDVHPGVKFRSNDQLTYIDKEISKIEDPRAKKALIEEKNRILNSIKTIKDNDEVWGGKYSKALHYYIDFLKDKTSLNGKTVHNMEQNDSTAAKLGFKKKQY